MATPNDEPSTEASSVLSLCQMTVLRGHFRSEEARCHPSITSKTRRFASSHMDMEPPENEAVGLLRMGRVTGFDLPHGSRSRNARRQVTPLVWAHGCHYGEMNSIWACGWDRRGGLTGACVPPSPSSRWR